MANQLYWYEGPATNGQRISGISLDQALELQKQEDELKKQQQADASLGPQISAGIHSYESSKGPQQPMQTLGNNSSPMSALSSPGPSQNTSSSPAPGVTVSRFGEDGFMDTVNNAVKQQQAETPSPFEGTPASDSLFSSLSGGGGAMSQMSSPGGNSNQYLTSDAATKQKAMGAPMQQLLSGIPEEIANDLVARYRMGDLKPSAFVKELTAIKKTLNDEKSEKDKADYLSKNRIAEKKNEAFFQTEDKILELDSQERRNQANIASQERMNREDNATLLENGKNKGNTREDRILGQIDKTLRNDYIVKQRTEQLQYAGNTVDMLMSDNPVANQGARTQLARLAGEVGVLTDADIKRFGGNQSVLSRAKQAGENALSGKLTDDNKKLLIAMAQRFKENSEKSLNERLNELALGQSEAFEVPIERITPLVQAYGVNNNPGQKTGAGGGGGSKTLSDPLGIR